MKIAIIEPHYDDAWLNLGGHILLHPEHEYLIISLSQDQNNNVDLSAKLSTYRANIRTAALALKGLTWDKAVVQRELAQSKLKSNVELFLLRNALTLASLLERLEALVDGYALAALPLGLFHPLHVVASQLTLSIPTVQYVEYPYAFFSFEQRNLHRRCHRKQLLSEDISAVVSEKRRIFEEVYDSQRFILTLSSCKTPLEQVTRERLYTKDPEAARRWMLATNPPNG